MKKHIRSVRSFSYTNKNGQKQNRDYYEITWTFSDREDKSITYTSSEVTSKVQVEQQFKQKF